MNENFIGRLNGVTVQELHKKIDYNVCGLEDRLELVEDICDSGFFEEYFDNHFKVNPNTTEPLSEDNNVCKLLDRLGTYILMSDEEKQRRKEIDDNCYSSGYLINKINREASLESIATDTDLSSTIIHNLKSDDVGKIAKNKTIYISHLTREKLDDILKDVEVDSETEKAIYSYMDYYESLNQSKYPKQQIDNIKMGIRKDIETLIERSVADVVHDNLEIYTDSTYQDEQYDLTQKHNLVGVTFYNNCNVLEHRKGLLFMDNLDGLDVNSNTSLVLNELEEIVNKSSLTKRERKVLTLIRKDVMMKEIADLLGVSIWTVGRDKSSIISKVLKTSKKLNKGECKDE